MFVSIRICVSLCVFEYTTYVPVYACIYVYEGFYWEGVCTFLFNSNKGRGAGEELQLWLQPSIINVCMCAGCIQ